MKQLVGFFAIAFLLLGTTGCGGDDTIFFISYPKSSFSGKNLLHEELFELDTLSEYSMQVQLDRGMAFKVILVNRSADLPTNKKDTTASFWFIKSNLQNTGWFVYDYDYETQSQTFITEGPSSPHIAMGFKGCGKMDVEIYERGNKKLTNTKQVSWESFCNP